MSLRQRVLHLITSGSCGQHDIVVCPHFWMLAGRRGEQIGRRVDGNREAVSQSREVLRCSRDSVHAMVVGAPGE